MSGDWRLQADKDQYQLEDAMFLEKWSSDHRNWMKTLEGQTVETKKVKKNEKTGETLSVPLQAQGLSMAVTSSSSWHIRHSTTLAFFLFFFAAVVEHPSPSPPPPPRFCCGCSSPTKTMTLAGTSLLLSSALSEHGSSFAIIVPSTKLYPSLSPRRVSACEVK